jgi:hypothetical protein
MMTKLWTLLQIEVHWAARLLVPLALVALGYLGLRMTGALEGLFTSGTAAAIAGGRAEAQTHRAFLAHQRQLLARAAAARDSARRLAADTVRLRLLADSLRQVALTAPSPRLIRQIDSV